MGLTDVGWWINRIFFSIWEVGGYMSVHMIRVVASTNGMTLSEINTVMDDWMSNQSEWEADSTNHVITERETGSGILYYGGTYRLTFDSEPKDTLLQKCGDKLKNKVDWYRLGYHVCDHDETDRTGCSWDDEREWTDAGVSIPSDVPDFL